MNSTNYGYASSASRRSWRARIRISVARAILKAVIVSGRDPQDVRGFAGLLARDAPNGPGLRVLGPAPAPLAVLRGRHRQRLLAIAGANVDLADALRPWLKGRRLPGSLRLHIDVDPYSFL